MKPRHASKSTADRWSMSLRGRAPTQTERRTTPPQHRQIEQTAPRTEPQRDEPLPLLRTQSRDDGSAYQVAKIALSGARTRQENARNTSAWWAQCHARATDTITTDACAPVSAALPLFTKSRWDSRTRRCRKVNIVVVLPARDLFAGARWPLRAGPPLHDNTANH